MTPGSFIHVGGLHDEPGIVSNGVKKAPDREVFSFEGAVPAMTTGQIPPLKKTS